MFEKLRTERTTTAQQRFLDAYADKPKVATAARLAGVHRATVYRWMTDPALVAAMRVAAQEFFRRTRARVAEEEAKRAEWRREREKARHPMRCAVLARVRTAKRR